MLEDRRRIWHGDTPPADLHVGQEGPDGKFIPAWLVPIEVVGSSDIPSAVRVLKQGDGGTTPKPNRLNGPRVINAGPATIGPAEGSSASGS